MLSPSDQALLSEYVNTSMGHANLGSMLGWLGTLQQIGTAAADPRLFEGNLDAIGVMASALTSFESQTSISDPFMGLNGTWRPTSFMRDETSMAKDLIAKRIRPFDREVLARFFTVLDGAIEQAGPAADFGAMHARLRDEAEANIRFSLLDPYYDARISHYPDARGSRPGGELFLAGRRDGTLPNVRIGSRSVDYLWARSQGMDLDLGRVEAAELMGSDKALQWDSRGIRPVHVTATSYEHFQRVCDQYADAVTAHAAEGYSLWFRGQSRAFRFPDVLKLSEIGWRATRKRLSQRLTHLEDDDLLIASAFRGFGERWKSQEGIAGLFASLGAWQLVANEMLQNYELFPVAPDVRFASTLAPVVREALEKWRLAPYQSQLNTVLKVSMGNDDEPPVGEHYVVIDGVEHFLFARRHRFDRQNAAGGLLLQHYGCPTGGLDISRAPDVALAFAAGGVGTTSDGRFVRHAGGVGRPVVYLMLLREGRDPFLPSEAMFNGADHPNRINIQKCGILFGSSSYCRNYAFRHVVARIELDFELPDHLDPEAVYPSRSEDPISDYVCRRFPEAYQIAKSRLAADGRGIHASDEPIFKPTYRD